MIRVLIADDEGMIRSALAALLRLEDDIEVVAECGDGERAVAEALRLQPDVCLLDLEMPELGGHEAVIRIRQELAPALPVITMSQTPMSGQCAKLAGVYGFLLKPVDADQLRMTIIKCISHSHMDD